MTATAMAPGTTRGTSMKRVALASYVGSAIEYYDFYIYGTAAALVFPKVFFPHLGTTMATVASMATFAAAFISRPVGAAFFGHFGDRLGRKTTLTATLLIMGLSTVAVGLVPGAATIGVAAPLILLDAAPGAGLRGRRRMGRLCPAGGRIRTGGRARPLRHVHSIGRRQRTRHEQPGVPDRQRRRSAKRARHSWIGRWRLPFLFSVGAGRHRLVRAAAASPRRRYSPSRKSRGADPGTPVVALFTAQRREVLLAAGSMVGFFAFGYMANAYLTSYAHTHVGYSPRADLVDQASWAVWWRVVFYARCRPCCATVFGRRRIIMVAFAAGVPWAFVVDPVGRHRQRRLVRAGDRRQPMRLRVTSYGPMAAFVPEIFATRYRYSGAGLALNLAGLIGGADAATDRCPARGGVGWCGDRCHAGRLRRAQPGEHPSATRNDAAMKP